MNLITDVPGLTVGHAVDERALTGVTTLLCARAMTAAVDVRGGAPGVRETETLSPDSLVGEVNAIVLSGGSVFGLAAADGVATQLSAADIGLHLVPNTRAIPIVPAAVLHDLGNGGAKDWQEPPYRELGARSLAVATRQFALGAVGAGRGARAGQVQGGVGSASIDLGDGLVVGALVVVNAVGSVYMPNGRTFWAWPFEIDREFGGVPPELGAPVSDPKPPESRLQTLGRQNPGASTVIGVVAVSAALTTAECRRLAIMAHDGLARAVRPAHTPFDGDTLFATATAALPLDASRTRAAHIARLGSAAADCMARAISRGVYAANPCPAP